MLNEVLVSGLPGLVDPSVHSQWSRSLQYARALVCAFVPVVRASCFPNLFLVKCPVLLFAVFFENSVRLLSSMNRNF